LVAAALVRKSSDESGGEVGAILESGQGVAQGLTYPVLDIPNGGELGAGTRVVAKRQKFTLVGARFATVETRCANV
jgi:hypothetical protein